MKIFTDDQDCILKVQSVISRFLQIDGMIKPADYIKWLSIIIAAGSNEAYLGKPEQKLNLLSTAMLIAHEEAGNQSPVTSHARNLFQKLEAWLNEFPQLQSDKSFQGKIKNLNELSFLSCLSELSLASFLKANNSTLQFETKFTKSSGTPKKDIDIEATDAAGNIANFEVYMPNHASDIQGFFDPHGRDSYFDYKVSKKLIDKFGNSGFSGLNGKVFLAVNYAFFDQIYVNSILPFLNNATAFEGLKLSLPQDVDGILFFRDNFAGGTSFHFDKLITI